jgi:hypothetical protein
VKPASRIDIAATSGAMPTRNEPTPRMVSICTRGPASLSNPAATISGCAAFTAMVAAIRLPRRGQVEADRERARVTSPR